MPPMSTVVEPRTTVSGAGLAHAHRLVTVAAIRLPMSTDATPVVIGPPTCGLGPSDIGQVCMSVTLAADSPSQPAAVPPRWRAAGQQ
jgi:hypothetical protein